jgi:hypothetical protein
VRIDLLLQLVVTAGLAVGAVVLFAHAHTGWGVVLGVMAIPLGQLSGVAFSVLEARK